jgi:CBS domain-containing protein
VVERIMRRNFVSADPEEMLTSALQTMRMARLRHLLVTRGDQLLGVLSYRELLEALLEEQLAVSPPDPRRVEDAMRRSPAFVTPRTSLARAADRVCRYGLGCLPVLEPPPRGSSEAGRLVGVLTETDLLRAVYANR